MSSGSVLLQPFKAVGLVTDDVPPHFFKQGSETFMALSLGSSYQIFRADRLAPVAVSATTLVKHKME